MIRLRIKKRDSFWSRAMERAGVDDSCPTYFPVEFYVRVALEQVIVFL